MDNTILIADDEEVCLQALSLYFKGRGFTVYSAKNCGEAIALSARYKPDCFLLDYHLEARTAAEICRYLRGDEVLKKAPVIILSGDPEQAVNSYDICQADVFIEKGKPFRELLALVKRQLRRRGWDKGLFTADDIVLDAGTLSVIRADHEPISLPPEQFRFFSRLFERSPDFVPEDEICCCVFKSAPAQAQTAVSSLVYRLRKNLGPQLSRRIKNKRNRGWIYVQPRFQCRGACR